VILHKFSKIEFYITNVCNLDCKGCNRFNNYGFRGWQAWQDYEEIYTKWSEYIEIDHIVVLGGEPLLNPDIIRWLTGLHRIFKCPVQVLTNGTRINQVKDLYHTLYKTAVWMGISWHNRKNFDVLDQELRKFFTSSNIKISRGPNVFGADYVYSDGILSVPVWLQDSFYSSAVESDGSGKFTLHDSDPLLAHELCGFVQYKNYHFVKGKLYKCGPVALFPEFDQQFQLQISNKDREILLGYQGLAVTDGPDHIKEFIQNIDKPIPQCKFCPINQQNHQIFAETKIKKHVKMVPV